MCVSLFLTYWIPADTFGLKYLLPAIYANDVQQIYLQFKCGLLFVLDLTVNRMIFLTIPQKIWPGKS